MPDRQNPKPPTLPSSSFVKCKCGREWRLPRPGAQIICTCRRILKPKKQ
jgi:hypothetical protein